MFEEDESASQAAISYADEFADAAIAKLDSLFGDGYAKNNPAAFAGYMTACASNLTAFMTAATAMQDDLFAEAMASLGEFEDELPPPPPAKSNRKRGR